MNWGDLFTQLAPTGGAGILAALLLFLLRIPQSSSVVAKNYEALITKAMERAERAELQAEELRDEVGRLEDNLLELRFKHMNDIDALRNEARRALEEADSRCDERLKELERFVKAHGEGGSYA